MLFTADMLIKDALLAHPDAASVFHAHDLPCASCLAADMETVADVAAAHDSSVAELLAALNALGSPDAEGDDD